MMNTAKKEDLLKEIPTFDMTLYETDFDRFSNAIGEGIQHFGFCGLINHGIDDTKVARVFDTIARFYDLPEETKRQYHLTEKGGQRGYIPFKTERAKDCKASDLKEFWHVGRELAAGMQDHLPERMRLIDNLWPAEIGDFKETMIDFYDTLDQLSNRVLEGLAVYLKLDRHFFTTRTDKGDSILRALHYPPQPDLEGEAIRAGAHEDINLITLLVGSNEPGLEIKDKMGRWIPVTTIEGTIVCNIGDMMQRVTNGIFPSMTHRVINPEGDHRKKSRYSIPFFKHPNRDCMLETVDSCITPDNPNHFEPITSHDYLVQRLIEIDLISHDTLPEQELPLFALKEIEENLIAANRPVSDQLKAEIARKS